MKLIVRNLRLSLFEEEALLFPKIAKRLNLPTSAIKNIRIVRRSTDARRKEDIHFLYSVVADCECGENALAKAGTDVALYSETPREPLTRGTQDAHGRPVVVGAGPCGMFAALTLARNGYQPIVIERGAPVNERVGDVNRFWSVGSLDPDSNVLFGEGGAGTFSDGKLTTRIKDSRCSDVLKDLSLFGAPQSITYEAKPHIGTDVLRSVVARLRAEVLRLGGEYRFHTRFTGFQWEAGELTAVKTSCGEIPAGVCVLATGHSARDVYKSLYNMQAQLVPKPFAVGVRIEHPRDMIDRAQLGKLAGHPRLGAAEYALTARHGERGVYTFCMCPGGVVVASSSEEGGVVTNGMSDSARNAENSNSALVVQVGPEDFGNHPLSGVAFQRKLERDAFALGGGDYTSPAQRVGDFLAGRASHGFGAVNPTYRPGVKAADLRQCLPGFVSEALADVLPRLGRQLKGFDCGDAVLTAVESRTSAPLRIQRDADYVMPGLAGVYPAGEGAGYAGGIVSAAVDGMRVAEEIIKKYRPWC